MDQVDEITESIVTLAAERRGGLEKTLRESQRELKSRGECVHEGILSFSVTPGLREPHKLSVYKKCWRFWLSSLIMKVQANRQKRSFYSSWPEGDYGLGNCSALLLWHWNVNRILGNVTSYKRTGHKIPLGRLWVWLSFRLFIFSVEWMYLASNQNKGNTECRKKTIVLINRPINQIIRMSHINLIILDVSLH